MTKELREALLDHFAEGAPSYKTANEAVKAEARLQAERILPLIDRYAAERERQARKNGYNAGWSTRNKTKPKIHRCICDSCRVIQEAALKETTK